MMTKEKSQNGLWEKGFIVVLAVCLTFAFGSESFADDCPNVVGDWDYVGYWAIYDPSFSEYSFVTQSGYFHITDQSDCVFYGTVERLTPSAESFPATGAIYGATNIIITTEDLTLHGILYAHNAKKGLYKKMKYSTSNISIEGGDQALLGTSHGKATRRW